MIEKSTNQNDSDNYCTECSLNPHCPPLFSSFVSDSILFVAHDTHFNCPHSFSFGNDYFCKCAGRIAQFKKSGK